MDGTSEEKCIYNLWGWAVGFGVTVSWRIWACTISSTVSRTSGREKCGKGREKKRFWMITMNAMASMISKIRRMNRNAVRYRDSGPGIIRQLSSGYLSVQVSADHKVSLYCALRVFAGSVWDIGIGTRMRFAHRLVALLRGEGLTIRCSVVELSTVRGLSVPYGTNWFYGVYHSKYSQPQSL